MCIMLLRAAQETFVRIMDTLGPFKCFDYQSVLILRVSSVHMLKHRLGL